MPEKEKRWHWREFYVDGAQATLLKGNAVTENTGQRRPDYWFSGPTTIVLGRCPDQVPEDEAETTAAWEVPVDVPAVASAERAFLVIACIRRFGGLHTRSEGGPWARISLNGYRIDAFRLWDRPAGHTDYFHSSPVPEDLPKSFVFSDYQTKTVWTIPKHMLVPQVTQSVAVNIESEVRWDIDYVGLVVAALSVGPPSEMSMQVTQYINQGIVGAMGEHAQSHKDKLSQLQHYEGGNTSKKMADETVPAREQNDSKDSVSGFD